MMRHSLLKIWDTMIVPFLLISRRNCSSGDPISEGKEKTSEIVPPRTVFACVVVSLTPLSTVCWPESTWLPPCA